MKRLLAVGLVLAMATVAGCRQEEAAAPPPPHALTREALGAYCGMNVLEHPGPKGQIILDSRLHPVWFSSARDALAFTMLPEEPKDVLAIYVSDMGKAPSWEEPGERNWVEAREAFFVIDSTRRGGMGAAEVVPFGERAAAEAFAADNGGRVVTFAEVPEDYVLGSGEPAETGSLLNHALH